ncbi:MAG: hypothetical protein H7069_08875, partial [Phormidesmis sp. FL-bin-119]|nr:hypothetical protein [Pedobacter sp.]
MMKKLALVVGICSIIAACSNSGESGSSDTTSVGTNQSSTAQQSNTDTTVNNIGTDSPVAFAGTGEE